MAKIVEISDNFNLTNSEYLGASFDEDGVYFQAVQDANGGWYVSAAYNWNSWRATGELYGHAHGWLWRDDGPYPTKADALLAGLDGARNALAGKEVEDEDCRKQYAYLRRKYRARRLASKRKR